MRHIIVAIVVARAAATTALHEQQTTHKLIWEQQMLNRLTFIALTALAAIFLASAFLFLQLNAEEPTVSPPSKPEEDPARFSVSTAVLPGQTSMTLLYITDAKTNKLHIYRAYGDMKTSFIEDPKLYRSFDLTSAGEANLREANQ